MALLVINRYDSHCGECGLSANPDEETHESVLGYKPRAEHGCRVRWTEVTSDYFGMEPYVPIMRPDLKWISPERKYRLDEIRRSK